MLPSLAARSVRKSRRAGFSLVEMLVAVTIMLLLVGAGVAAFISFDDRQTVVQAAKTVQSYLRSAQTKARVGDTPSGCTKLLGYVTRINAGSNVIRTIAVCEGNQEFERSTYELPTSIEAISAVNIQFLVLHGGVAEPGTVEIGNQSWEYSFNVTQGGEITAGEISERVR